MITIELKITGKRYKRKIPTSFGELTRKQLLQYVDLLFSNKQLQSLDELPASFKTQFISKLLRLPDKALYQIGDAGMVEIVQQCEGIFKPDSANSIGNFLLGFRRLYLPKWDLEDLTFIEFSFAEGFYQSIIDNEGDQEENINQLIAALCQQYQFRWKQFKYIRTPYNDHQSSKISDLLKKHSYHHFGDLNKMAQIKTIIYGVPPVIKHAVFFWYIQARLKLVQDYPAVFSNGGESSGPDFTSQYGWNRVGMEIAESGQFGTFTDVGNTPVHTILYHISYKNDLAKEQKMKNQINNG